MSATRRLIVTLLLVVCAASVARSQDATTIVPGASVGPLRLGMTEEQVISVFGKPELRGPASESGDPSVPVTESKASLFVLQYFKKKITLLSSNGKISEIIVMSSAYRTEAGVGVDSTLSEVQNAFGSDFVRKDGQYGPDISYPKQGVRFLFMGEQVLAVDIRPPAKSAP